MAEDAGLASELRRRDRLTVLRDGEEIEVFGWVNVDSWAIVRGSNPVVDYAEPEIGAGDSSMHPDAVTHWVADEVEHEFGIDVRDHDIEIIDPTDDEVTVA